ncbi:hypothetical protein FIV50_06120 [Microbacterium foliorum]|uniref:Uncharacterized protein n=1 Tax=Microbacterium foliorum TaxID=104336 RepID=A0A4Y5YNK6_9MICO|nr:hypothetical protein [Microbacterium foliorum]QDE34402.1 hypothetical protein FIV50_06120 [Microbacterium foliorum]
MESRHLGPITLDGGPGGGAMNGSVPFEGKDVQARIEIDFPDRFDESVLNDVDMVLDNLAFLDEMARTTIAEGVRRDSSPAAGVFRTWEQGRVGGASEDDFVDGLSVARVLILPDGGTANRDRVVMSYVADDAPALESIRVKFVEPTGPELTRSYR